MRASNERAVRQSDDVTAEARLLSLSSVTPEAIRRASKTELSSLQRIALLGETWGVLELPEDHQPGVRISPLDLSTNLPKGVKEGSAAATFFVTEMMRAAIAMALLPGSYGKPKKLTTIRVSMANLGRLFLRKPFTMKGGRMWSNIVIDGSISKSYRSSAASLTHYHRVGCLPDAPATSPVIQGNDGPRDRSGEREHSSHPISHEQIQPYSDEFVSEAGWAAATMIRVVGPTMLDAVEAALKIKPRTMTVRGPRRRLKKAGMAAFARDPIIRSWRWMHPDGTILETVPITFHIHKGLSKVAACWPPRTFDHAMRMVQILQGAHTFPIGLATGVRHGGLASLQVGSLSKLKGGADTMKFRTWKLDGPGGRWTDAPVPTLACESILQQERLARIFKAHHGLKNTHLWVSHLYPGTPPSIPHLMRTFIDGLGLRRFVSNGGVNPHRFRKTLARLAALALVHAPKILMDAFGHRDEQMTVLRYILSDPSILAEVQEIVREMIILKGVEAVQNADVIQGSGSSQLRAKVEQFAKRLGESALEPKNISEFAQALTEDGTSWAFVTPDIVCTSFTKGGLCNKGRGKPDPHYCDPACDNQIIFPDGAEGVGRAVVNAIETVEYALGLLESASKDMDDMLVAHYRGQIRSLLNRWSQVDRHFAASRKLKRLVPGVVLIA